MLLYIQEIFNSFGIYANKHKEYLMQRRLWISLVVIFFVLLALLALFRMDRTRDHVRVAGVVETKKPITREDLRVTAHHAASAAVQNASDKKLIDLRHMAFRKKEDKRGKEVEVRRLVNDFYATNLGLPHTKNGTPLPDELTVSFDANMAEFWKKKVGRESVTDSTLSKAPEILERYLQMPRGFTTLSDFIKSTDRVVEQAKKSLDWERLCKRYKLESLKCTTLKSVTYSLRGKDFIAYGMTELLPQDGRFNVKYLDMLLKHAGTSYLMHFPAMHDDMLSLGFYQFTSFALRKDEEVTEGTSIVNGFVKEGGMKIPNSVAYLVGDDHHVAAVYFAVHNLAKMLYFLNDKSAKAFLRRHKDFQGEMVMFVASAHHLPGTAWTATKKWIEGGMKHALERSYPKSIKFYAIKTHENLIALREMK